MFILSFLPSILTRGFIFFISNHIQSFNYEFRENKFNFFETEIINMEITDVVIPLGGVLHIYATTFINNSPSFPNAKIKIKK